METTLSWVVPALGIVLSWYSLRWVRFRSKLTMVPSAVFVSLVIICLLVIASAYVNAVCVENEFCRNYGDGNMAYWFNAIFISPLYLIFAIKGAGEY
jgi:multisubunit Na+/H+ antiporter MnhB subunit